ncbi:MAG: tetratricopeptide repeat protein [Thermodesulfobacteriota bacterium]
MSLIHQALKKLDDSRGPYPAEASPLAAATGRAAVRISKTFALAALFIALAITAALASRFYTARTEQVATTAAPPAPVPRAVGPAVAPAAVVAAKPSERERPLEARGALNEGLALYGEGMYREAAALFKRAAEAAPANAVYRNNLALALMRSGDTAGAEASFREALRLIPAYPEALNNYGTLLAALGHADRALTLFEKAAGLDPAYPDPHLNAAVILDSAGRGREALASYDRFLALGGDEAAKALVRRKAAELRSRIALEGGLAGLNNLP